MTKQFRLYQGSVIWETCFLLAEVVNWLQSHATHRPRVSKFHQLLPLHTNRNLQRLTRGRVYST